MREKDRHSRHMDLPSMPLAPKKSSMRKVQSDYMMIWIMFADCPGCYSSSSVKPLSHRSLVGHRGVGSDND